MKKILVLFFAAIMCCSVAQAQFHIGTKAGDNFSNYVGDNAPHKMNVNYHVGGFVEFGVLGILSVAPEVMFSAQGGTEKVPELHGGDVVYKNAKIKWNTNYVNIPVMLKLNLLGKFSLDFGPQFGFNVTSKCKTEIENFEGQSYDYKDQTNKFDLALGVGATYNINRFIFVQGRYMMSVTKSYKSNVLGVTLPVDARNGVLQLSVGVKL